MDSNIEITQPTVATGEAHSSNDNSNEATKCTEDAKDGHPKHFIIIVRHGERSDDAERDIKTDIDSQDPHVKFD